MYSHKFETLSNQTSYYIHESIIIVKTVYESNHMVWLFSIYFRAPDKGGGGEGIEGNFFMSI